MSEHHDDEVVLECRSLSKSYGSLRALKGVDLTLRQGEVRALLGKNGAGKSTLVNLISGSQAPDDDGAGEIRLAGESVRWAGPADARAGGVSIVHQEFSLIPGLSVAENITLGQWPTGRLMRSVIDRRRLDALAQAAIDKLGIGLPLWRLAGSLSLAQQQLVEIAKSLLHNPRVLILDEPTSALNTTEASALLALVRRLAAQGMSVIYISHRMQEIPLVADSLTVLRDGVEVATLAVGEANIDEVAELIAGESGKVAAALERRDRRGEPVVLQVRGLAAPPVEDVSFTLHDGEVLGIAGLLGSGRTEILECIYGIRRSHGGEVLLRGQPVERRAPRKMLRRGVGLSPEDRKFAGFVPRMSVAENLVLAARGIVLPSFLVHSARERSLADRYVKLLSIAASSPRQPIASLSGGNQQKGVIGRLIAADMQILLLDEPTRGIDVHAKAQIYRLIRQLATEGIACIFVSSELEELSEVCDRVLVLRDGRITAEVHGNEASAERLLSLSMKVDVNA